MAYFASTVNFPTFFRHARSRPDAVIALALILVFHTFLQISTIFYGIDVLSINISNATQSHMILKLVLSTFFILISFICINLINVYFISACWETISPRDYGGKKYVICAIVGTIVYTYFAVTNNTGGILMLENAIVHSMAILGLSLLINSLISSVVKRRTLFSRHFLGSVSWLVGCIVTIRSLIQAPEEVTQSLIFGVVTTVLFFIGLSFIETAVWSLKDVIVQKRT